MRDGDLLTSKESGIWHCMFDLKLNALLQHTSSKLVFNRGFEFLLENREELCAQAARLPMDAQESSRRVKELARLVVVNILQSIPSSMSSEIK